MAARARQNMRLPPEVNRALYVRNLPFKITAEEMYDIFGKFGAIRQIRLGNASDTRGTAFVVYEDIYDAKNALDHLSGFNVCGRYLVVLYYQQTKMMKRLDTEREMKELAEMRARLGIDTGALRHPRLPRVPLHAPAPTAPRPLATPPRHVPTPRAPPLNSSEPCCPRPAASSVSPTHARTSQATATRTSRASELRVDTRGAAGSGRRAASQAWTSSGTS